MENEHLNNCGEYRAVHDVPLPFKLDQCARNAAPQAPQGEFYKATGAIKKVTSTTATHTDDFVDDESVLTQHIVKVNTEAD